MPYRLTDEGRLEIFDEPTIDDLATQIYQANAKRSRLKKRVKELKDQLATALAEREIPSDADLNGSTWYGRYKSRTGLSVTRLIEEGVPITTINACKVKTKASLTITRIKSKELGTGEEPETDDLDDEEEDDD